MPPTRIASIPPRIGGSGLLAVLLATSLLAGCDLTHSGGSEPEVVVESYQVAGKPLAPVRLSMTAGIDEAYDEEVQAIRGAEVSISLLGDEDAIEERYVLSEEDEPGVYQSPSKASVLPLRRYRLDVRIPETGDEISAMTVVPDTFQILVAGPDTVVYRSDSQFELRLTRSTYPGRDQAFFIFKTEALEPTEANMTSLVREIYDNGDATLEELSVSMTPPLNEENFEINPDNTVTIEMPWLMVAFVGPQRISASAIDQNLYDFTRSHLVQQGGSTLSPGEIPNIIDHVQGGTGVFCSYARVETAVYIRPADAG